MLDGAIVSARPDSHLFALSASVFVFVRVVRTLMCGRLLCVRVCVCLCPCLCAQCCRAPAVPHWRGGGTAGHDAAVPAAATSAGLHQPLLDVPRRQRRVGSVAEPDHEAERRVAHVVRGT